MPLLPPSGDSSSSRVFNPPLTPSNPLPSSAEKSNSDSVAAKVNAVKGESIPPLGSSESIPIIYPVSKSNGLRNPADVEQNEATQNFLSKIPSRMRSFFASVKQGVINFGASVNRFFSSLFENKQSNAAVKPAVPQQQVEKERIRVEIKALSPEAKRNRMEAFVKFFTEDVVKSEGIFRISPSFDKMKKFNQLFLEESFRGFEGEDVDEVASLFKNFIGSVDLFETRSSNDEPDSGSVISGDQSARTRINSDDESVTDGLTVKELLLQAAGLQVGSAPETKEVQIKMLKEAIQKMKPENVALLQSFLVICSKVILEEENKMNAKNLSIVFGPNFADQINFNYNPVIQLLIQHREILFR